MLKSLRVSGFKSITDAKLAFGRVNLFIGANGSGKSNILEAIGVLAAALGRDITDAELQRKGVRLSVPILFKSSFKDQKLKPNFGLNATMNQSVNYNVWITAGKGSQTLRFFSESIRCQKQTYLKRSNLGVSLESVQEIRKNIASERGLWDRFKEVISVPDALTEELNQLSEFCIYTPQTSFLRGSDVEPLPVKPIGLLGGGLPQATMTILSQIDDSSPEIRSLMTKAFDLVWMPGWASQLIVGNFDPESVSSRVKTGETTLYFQDRFMKDGRDRLSAYDSSEGSLYLLFLAVLLLHPEAPKIFALDNVDNALNPAATRALLERLIDVTCGEQFQKHNIGPKQVFLTSHNPTSLDAFDLFDEDQRIFVVSREKTTGFTKIERLKPRENMTREDWIRASGGKNLSEIWISGLIPDALGVPDL